MAEFQPHATYSKTADAVYIYLAEGDVARTRILDDRRMVDLSEDNRVLGVELLDVKSGVDLNALPSRDQIEDLLRDFHLQIFA